MSKQSYKQLAIPHFKEVFDIIDKVLSGFGIPYYLIGVSAISLELLQSGIKPARGTKDIDFAVMIASLSEFQEVVNALKKDGFNKVEAPWTLYHPDFGVVVDLLPFGEIEQESSINFNERFTDLHVLGLKEVLGHAKAIPIEENFVKIPPLPGMVLLKLIAWSDRPEDRPNDLYDILLIIEHYFDLEYDEIITHHHDIFPEDDFNQLKIAARVLGRHARSYLLESDKIRERILSVLGQNIETPSESMIAKNWARRKGWTIAFAIELLTEFKKGLTEEIA